MTGLKKLQMTLRLNDWAQKVTEDNHIPSPRPPSQEIPVKDVLWGWIPWLKIGTGEWSSLYPVMCVADS